jgi:hypothetical protein
MRTRVVGIVADGGIEEPEVVRVPNARVAFERPHAERQKIRGVEFGLGVQMKRALMVDL